MIICRHCDRGNRYCPSCARLARAEKQRAAGKKYQQTKAGRLNHKVRQERCRDRPQKNVTHHGDLGIGERRKSATVTRGGSDIRNERRPEPPEPLSGAERCDFCGRPCRGPGRTGPLPRHTRAYRRGPRLPRHEPGRRHECAAAIVRARRPVRRRIGSTLPSDAGSGNEPTTLRLEVAFWR